MDDDLLTLAVERKLLLDEVKHLRKQRDELQVTGTRLVEKARGLKCLVHEFHKKFGYSVRATPTVPGDEEVRFRLRLIAEEFFEVLEACGGWKTEPFALQLARKWTSRFIENFEVAVDMVGLAHELTDVDIVVEGTRVSCGIDGWPIAQEIMAANMRKENQALLDADAAKAAGTKAQKPPGWKPANVEAQLMLQGWRRG